MPVKKLVVVLYLVCNTEISVRTDVISYSIVGKLGVTGFKQNYPLVGLMLQNGFVCFIWGIITLNLDLADRSQRAMSQGLKWQWIYIQVPWTCLDLYCCLPCINDGCFFGMLAISEISAIADVQNWGLVLWNQKRKAWVHVQRIYSYALKSSLAVEPGQVWWLCAFDWDKKKVRNNNRVWKGGDKGWRGGMRKGMPASAAADFELCRSWSKAVGCQHKWRARKDLTDINMTAFFSCRSAKEQTQILTYIILFLR